MNGRGPNRRIGETLSFRDDLTYIKGTHAFKMGYELLRFRINSTSTTYRPMLVINYSVAAGTPPAVTGDGEVGSVEPQLMATNAVKHRNTEKAKNKRLIIG